MPAVSEKEALITELVMTLSAPAVATVPIPSETAAPSPTPQATETRAPTLAPSNTATRPPVATGSLCDNAAYVSDVTIQDGTAIDPGDAFSKTWTIRNTGACDWTTSYSIAFVSGDAMGGAATKFSSVVNAGDAVDVTVELVAPTASGKYTGYWRLKNADGAPFGEVVYVQIVVGSATTTTATPTPIGTLTPTPESTSTAIPATNTMTPTP